MRAKPFQEYLSEMVITLGQTSVYGGSWGKEDVKRLPLKQLWGVAHQRI